MCLCDLLFTGPALPVRSTPTLRGGSDQHSRGAARCCFSPAAGAGTLLWGPASYNWKAWTNGRELWQEFRMILVSILSFPASSSISLNLRACFTLTTYRIVLILLSWTSALGLHVQTKMVYMGRCRERLLHQGTYICGGGTRLSKDNNSPYYAENLSPRTIWGL
ncbi:hypothetical protein BDZ90DRAFT_126896 [Jaminaea rosea]|uniref:Uncharacterized protein n=1 Tax=Jaminaea rosea TaxID=1569628 RepID=A0A316UGJ2_9BASI|nr:hypothetical protein BDZ90DRAFT_126896 [Jaminaea rosea]PWN24330.1 hypothetical protein BDZ90DRAFT_126896 [Jaminaea rosea]